MFVPESPIPDSPIAMSTPHHHNTSTVPTHHSDILDMLQKFQSSVETQLASVASGLSSVTTRMTELESQQQALEREVKGACKTAPSSTPHRRRRRRRDVPTALQV